MLDAIRVTDIPLNSIPRVFSASPANTGIIALANSSNDSKYTVLVRIVAVETSELYVATLSQRLTTKLDMSIKIKQGVDIQAVNRKSSVTIPNAI